MFANVQRNHELILSLIKRDIIGRYRGSFVGLAWSFFNPIFMLAIYTFMFSLVFQMRWGIGEHESRLDFAILIFIGMIVHGLFAECVNRAPGLIIANTNFVKKIVFPLDILPVVVLGATLFHSAISLIVLLLVQMIFNQHLPITALLFPIILSPIIFFSVGFTWFLASLGVYLRDIGQAVVIFTSALLFISAVFFPISALPEDYRILIHLNPLAIVIDQSRDVLIFGKIPDMATWLTITACGVITAWLGYAWFQKTRKGFADVL